jgi:hypothetical protein
MVASRSRRPQVRTAPPGRRRARTGRDLGLVRGDRVDARSVVVAGAGGVAAAPLSPGRGEEVAGRGSGRRPPAPRTGLAFPVGGQEWLISTPARSSRRSCSRRRLGRLGRQPHAPGAGHLRRPTGPRVLAPGEDRGRGVASRPARGRPACDSAPAPIVAGSRERGRGPETEDGEPALSPLAGAWRRRRRPGCAARGPAWTAGRTRSSSRSSRPGTSAPRSAGSSGPRR